MNTPRRRVALLAAVIVVLGCQPRDETPGLWLRGEIVGERVDDWRFTREIDEIFVETRPWYGIPHSTTIWCVEIDGKLYVGSYGEDKKTWENNIARNPEAKLRIDGKIYEVRVSPITDAALTKTVDVAYTQKYDMAEVFGDDLPLWWYYSIE